MRILLPLLTLFLLLATNPFLVICPSRASSWDPLEAPFSQETAMTLKNWETINGHELWTNLTDEEHLLFDRLVRGTLIWAHANGNHFDREQFLALFSEKDDSVSRFDYADGGILLLIRNVYLKIALDRVTPYYLDPGGQSEYSRNGRWYAMMGSSNRNILFFLAAINGEFGFE